MRDFLADKTASYLVDNIKDYSYLSQILSRKKKQEYKELSKNDIYGIFNYAFQALYGETMKILLMLIIAYMLNMFLPVAIICLVFATLRTVAGGVHMDSFMKCLISTAILFLIPSYAINKVNLIYNFSNIELIIIIGIVYIVSFYLANKYAPRDTETKRITDPIKIKRYKKQTKIYLLVLTIISLLLVTMDKSQLIILSINLGIMLEMLTITPVGVKMFHGFRDVINKTKVIGK